MKFIRHTFPPPFIVSTFVEITYWLSPTVISRRNHTNFLRTSAISRNENIRPKFMQTGCTRNRTNCNIYHALWKRARNVKWNGACRFETLWKIAGRERPLWPMIHDVIPVAGYPQHASKELRPLNSYVRRKSGRASVEKRQPELLFRMRSWIIFDERDSIRDVMESR